MRFLARIHRKADTSPDNSILPFDSEYFRTSWANPILHRRDCIVCPEIRRGTLPVESHGSGQSSVNIVANGVNCPADYLRYFVIRFAVLRRFLCFRTLKSVLFITIRGNDLSRLDREMEMYNGNVTRRNDIGVGSFFIPYYRIGFLSNLSDNMERAILCEFS